MAISLNNYYHAAIYSNGHIDIATLSPNYLGAQKKACQYSNKKWKELKASTRIKQVKIIEVI
jgi:hypothetical protein